MSGGEVVGEKQNMNLVHDLLFMRRVLKIKKDMKKAFKNKWQVADVWYNILKKHPQKAALLFEDQKLTFQDVEDRSNQVSHFFVSQGLNKGDTVALIMSNRPEFVVIWLGLTKIGVKIAMVNTHIKQKGLLHCLRVSFCKMVIVGNELIKSVLPIKDELASEGIKIFGEGEIKVSEEDTSGCEDITNLLKKQSSEPTDPVKREGISLTDPFGFIYTSGTTGLPKAAVIMHMKMLSFGVFIVNAFKVRPSDIVYDCLPLFHSAGGGLGIGMLFYCGCTVAIAKRFSASNFWKDCVKYKCTVVQYIGELCRYLVLQGKTPEETQHKVRLAIGNGLRPEVWGEFQDRFQVPEVGEFYGSTEGNGALVNHCTTKQARGACGRYGKLLQKATNTRLVKFDVIEETEIRDPQTGFCIEALTNEPGQLLWKIDPKNVQTRFAGYTDDKASQKKILCDVFEKGDQYFSSGDLLKVDKYGYFRFVDRIGDTFRWKGENCSTSEITEILSTVGGIQELNVYGVEIPNNLDGRAPAAALTPIEGDMSKVDMVKFLQNARENLPPYAIPIFIRITKDMEVTATMKHQKVKLKNEGIDLSKVSDELLWLNPETKQYEPFGPNEHEKLVHQKVRV